MTDETDEEFFGEEDLQGNDSAEMKARMAKAYKDFREAEAAQEIASEAAAAESKKLNKLKTDTFPALLAEMGTDVWKDPETGVKVETDTAVGTLPKAQDKRNETLDALRPLGVEEIMAEEFVLLFIPGDPRTEAVRMLLGLEAPDDVIDDGEDTPSERLSNEQVAAIHDLRALLGWDKESLPADQKLGVHGTRFKAWCKKMIEGGKGTEIRDAGIWHGKIAKVGKVKK